MIEKKDYKYKELCALMNDKPKTGKSKKLQLEDWKRFFNWVNPTTQIFRVTEVYDAPKEKINNHGGARKGSGAKKKVQEEFDWLFNAFLSCEFNRNSYNAKPRLSVAYFNNSKISKYFGLYADNFYDGKKDDKDSFNMVCDKLIEKRRSWILDKIKKVDGVTYSDGIIAYKTDEEFEYKDDFLEEWNAAQSDYIKLKKCRSIKDVITRELWTDMIDFISSRFDGYVKVEKVHKVEYDVSILKEYELDDYEKYRRRFNEKVVKEIAAFFEKKCVDVKHIIDNYVKL